MRVAGQSGYLLDAKQKPAVVLHPRKNPSTTDSQDNGTHGTVVDPYLVDIVNHTVHHLTFERLEYYGAVSRDELGLAAPTDDHPFSDIEDRNDRYDVSECS